MRNRAVALVAVAAFAGAVTAVAVTAGNGGDDLVKLPVAAAVAAEDAAVPSQRTAALGYPAPDAVEYRLGGPLPALPEAAPAYRLGASASRAAVARLAESLGVSGAVGEEEHGWVVADDARELRVQKAPGLPWSLGPACPEAAVSSSDAGAATAVACPAKPGAVAVDGGAGTSGAGAASSPGRLPPDRPVDSPPAEPVPAPDVAPPPPDVAPRPADVAPPPPDVPPRPADLPGRDEAQRIARELFTRIGVGAEGLVVDDAHLAWEARADRRLGGLPVLGWTTSASIGPRGRVLWASGFLAEPERIGDYPLVGAEKGFERLRQAAVAGPVPLVARDATAGPPEGAGGAEPADCAEPTVICEPAGPGTGSPARPEPVAPPTPVVHTVAGAHLALLHLDATLVPVYVFEVDDGGESLPVPAVTEEWLDRRP